MSYWQVMCARLANAFAPDDLLVFDNDNENVFDRYPSPRVHVHDCECERCVPDE
jgi:hypothetical protein